nr:uncharacterized protein I303_06670 [Kwoniella dejecticola CBS 10117]OBR83111.1 hypothetical protein I303_06670 [Kwoniella dejecticola CBS 10117]
MTLYDTRPPRFNNNFTKGPDDPANLNTGRDDKQIVNENLYHLGSGNNTNNNTDADLGCLKYDSTPDKGKGPKLTDPDKGNQATYLFFPVFAVFLLVLLTNLSTPIISGLSIAKLTFEYEGQGVSLNLGSWGWCLKGMKGFEDTCSDLRGFSSNFSSTFNQLPDPLKGLSGVSESVDKGYLVADALMHLFAGLTVYLTLNWTLASSGSWKAKETHAYNWTRWAFVGVGYSSLMILIAWSLDTGMLTKIQSKVKDIQIDGVDSISVKPGALIFMNLFSFLLCLGLFIVRMTWGKFKPRPGWTIKGNSDFHIDINVHPPPPDSAALPPNDDLPPTWDSLNISDDQIDIDEKPPIIKKEDIKKQENAVDQRGFIV